MNKYIPYTDIVSRGKPSRDVPIVHVGIQGSKSNLKADKAQLWMTYAQKWQDKRAKSSFVKISTANTGTATNGTEGKTATGVGTKGKTDKIGAQRHNPFRPQTPKAPEA